MSDLEQLAAWCRLRAADPDTPERERELWLLIIGEIEAYLSPVQEVSLFDA